MTPTTRVRLYGGRLTHTAKPNGNIYKTDCGRYVQPEAVNHWLPDTAIVTCRTCERKTDAR